MVLTRTGSAMSTLTSMQRRATRYQKYLTMASVILIITSTIVIFSSVVLMKFYHLTSLHFWHTYFYITPMLMVALGIYKFVVSIYGFAITGTENRCVLALFAILLSLAFIGQLGSIFTAIEVRTKINLGDYTATNVNDVLRKYGEDDTITAEWDSMQRELRCCGGFGSLDGHTSYTNTPIGGNNSVPDSCCRKYDEEGCGKGLLGASYNSEQVRNKIYVTGCLTALEYSLENDVVMMMAIYAGVGVLIALIELIAVVLTCAYIAQITRRRTREEIMWNAVRGGDEMDHKEAARALNPSVDHETMC